MITQDKITNIFCTLDEFSKKFDAEVAKGELCRVQQQVQHYKIFLKKHNLGVSNCSFSLGLLLSLY